MDGKHVDCNDFFTFQDALNKMRQLDDKVLFELNSALPSHSFSSNVDFGKRCRILHEELLVMRKLRMDLIQRCVNENQSKVAKLRNDDTSFSEMRTTQNRIFVHQRLIYQEDTSRSESGDAKSSQYQTNITLRRIIVIMMTYTNLIHENGHSELLEYS
ncbi:unnamed protein product [Dracunculus medinensis]|uniref:Protein MIX23 n=1 Tax=Dracunculus medinensis TaxID=318479 RepID=A0A0N4UH00_DRAME|nr:unnamed protein product [Dracunculus medinensis]